MVIRRGRTRIFTCKWSLENGMLWMVTGVTRVIAQCHRAGYSGGFMQLAILANQFQSGTSLSNLWRPMSVDSSLWRTMAIFVNSSPANLPADFTFSCAFFYLGASIEEALFLEESSQKMLRRSDGTTGSQRHWNPVGISRL